MAGFLKCPAMQRPTRYRSACGGLSYRDAGRIVDCMCKACRDERKRNVARDIKRQVPAELQAGWLAIV